MYLESVFTAAELCFQVYISQILVASALGSVVDAVGSVRVIPAVASGGSFLGFLSACFLVIYPDVEPTKSEQDQDFDDLPGQSDPREGKNGEQRLALLKLKDGVKSKTTENQSVAWTVQSHSESGCVLCRSLVGQDRGFWRTDKANWSQDWAVFFVLLLPQFRNKTCPVIQILKHRVAVLDYWNRWNISCRDTIGLHIEHFLSSDSHRHCRIMSCVTELLNGQSGSCECVIGLNSDA